MKPGARSLDLACGTGDIAFELAARGAPVVGLDVTPRLIALARAKPVPRRAVAAPAFLVGDMMALPFPDASFDLVTTGYGLRNMPLVETALAEESGACCARAGACCRSISTAPSTARCAPCSSGT